MREASRTTARAAAIALLADVSCILVFCAIGRRSHAEGITVAGVAETAWPFLSGTAAGWLAARAWQRPTSLAPAGIVIWLSTVVIGMMLRKATSQGTAISFVVVASLSTAILLLGWRLGARVLARR
jgi:peptidoglycan/LPS O-acetylase OafA/YrhL